MSESDQVASAPSGSSRGKGRRNFPGNRTDPGWKHGLDVQGNGKRVKCNYCSKTVCGGIFRFKHHLAGSGEDSEPCATVPDEVRHVFMRIVAEAKEASKKKRRVMDVDEDVEEVHEDVARSSSQQRGFSLAKGKAKVSGPVQATINQMVKKGFKEEVDDQVAKYFYTSAIPFNTIKNKEFEKMCEKIGKFGMGYKPPSYHDIRGKLLKRAVKQTDDMLEEFKMEWKRTGCTIMSDGWTDKKRRSICNFLVNSPMGTVFLYSLDTSDISKTTEKVLQMLDDAVEFVGEENVVQVVTDNAANFKAAGELLMLSRPNLYWTPCAAHCIDLMLEDLEKHLKVHQVTIRKGRKICNYIYCRTQLISMVKKFTKGRDLIRPGKTRFATAYLTLACLNELKASLLSMFSSKDWTSSKFAKTVEGRKVEDIICDNRFWKNIIVCLKAAAPLIVVLRLVDSDQTPAMGFIYEGMDCAKEQIRRNFKDVKKCYEPIWNIIDERWDKQLHRPLHAAGYYLNPSLHYEPKFNHEDTEVKIGLYACMKKMVADAEERKKIGLQLAEFHYHRGLFGIEAAKESRKSMKPAEWWDFYGDETLELKRFAIRVLSLTCSSSGCERNWSVFEQVHTKRRNRLLQENMNDLVYVMYNLKLKSRETRRSIALPFEDIHSDDEWITEDRDAPIVDEENVEEPIDIDEENVEEHINVDEETVQQPINDPRLDVFIDENIEEVVSSGEELDYDDYDDDGDGGDNGDDVVRGLNNI